MASSMTGFGQFEISRDGIVVKVEVSSLNFRYFDCQVRLPRRVSHLENIAKETIRSRINRGKVLCNVSWEVDDSIAPAMKFSEPMAEMYIDILEKARKKYNLAGEITVTDLLNLEGVFTPEEDSADSERDRNLLQEAVNSALDKLEEMRKAEGARLLQDIAPRVGSILESIGRIRALSKESVQAYREKLQNRMKELIGDSIDATDRIAMEAAMVAERCDVTEECVRTESHCQQLAETLKDGEQIGKRLNFILQELNREANTIGSKSIVSSISREVIDLKEQIEKIREQVQNLE